MTKLFLSLIFSVSLISCNSQELINSTDKIEKENEDVSEDQNKFLKIVKDITSKGFVRNNYKKNLVDLSDIKINLKGKK